MDMILSENITDQLVELESKLAAKTAELKDIATMGAVITSIHEINSVLTVVMETALNIVKGEVGLILLNEHDNLVEKISWGIPGEFVKSLLYLEDLDIATYAFEKREAVILSDLDLVSDNGMKLNSIIAVPIKNDNTCFGVLTIINRFDGCGFHDEDREHLEALLNFVAVAIDNSQLMETKLKQQKVEQEMTIAHQIQKTILPQDIENFEGIEIGAVYYPARDVGGDYYDIIKMSEKEFVVVIGDVSNKGVPAALIMTAAAGIIKATLANKPDISIAELANTTNNILSEGIIRDRQMFITLFFCKYDLENMELTYCNAGHMPGLFWDSQAEQIIELPVGGTIVGQFAGLEYKQGIQKLNKGDRLFLYTDGLTEAADDAGNWFGRERAEQVYTMEIGLSPQEFCYKVKEWIDRFTVGCSEENVDDFTILQIKAL